MLSLIFACVSEYRVDDYRVDDHKKSLGQLVFPNYEIFDDINAAYLDFFQKIMTVIDKIAPFKTKRVKGNTQKWFDGEVLEKLSSRDKLFQKFKKSRLHIDKELFKKAKYEALKLIATKKQAFFKEKISESIKIIKIDIPKAAGKDRLSGRFSRDGAKILSRPIFEICNLSISLGVFSDACKVAKLKPIYKKGKKTDPFKYRLSSLLPIISKVIERIVQDQTNKFLSQNNILYNFQSGFRPNHSTNLCCQIFNRQDIKWI